MLLWVQKSAIGMGLGPYRVVEVRTRRVSGTVARPDLLSLGHWVPGLYGLCFQVQVHGLRAVRMVDPDVSPVTCASRIADGRYKAIRPRMNRVSRIALNVQAAVFGAVVVRASVVHTQTIVGDEDVAIWVRGVDEFMPAGEPAGRRGIASITGSA